VSRFSPTVLPTGGRALADALGQGVNTYLATRRLKREDDLADTERQRSEAVQNAQLGEQGIHLTKPGELPPQFDVNVSGGPNAEDITSAAIRGQPTPTGQPLAAALSRHVTAGPGYYVDEDERASHIQQQTAIAQAQALAKALGEGTAQNILDPNARSDKHAVAQSTVKKNEAQAAGPTGKTLPTAGGYVQVGRDGSATPLIGSNGRPLMPYAPPPPPPGNVYVTGVGPDGSPTIYAGKNKGPAALTDTGVGKPSGGAGGSAQTAMALQRLGMSAGDVEHAITEMEVFENDPQMRAKLTSAQQAMGSASQVTPDDHAHGMLGVLNNAGGSLVSSAARAGMDKDLQRYMRNKQLVGLAFTEALPRPNQALLGMEKGLSGIDAGGFTDPIIADVQSRRRMGLQQLRTALGTLGAPKAAGHAAPATSSSGNVDLRQPASKPPLADRIQQLRQQGLSKEAAKAQLQHEGYDLHGGD
jgi:hypothetical protein